MLLNPYERVLGPLGAMCCYCNIQCTRIGKYHFQTEFTTKGILSLKKRPFLLPSWRKMLEIFLHISLLFKKHWSFCQCTSLPLNPKPHFYLDKMEQEEAYRHTYLPYICRVKTSDFYSLLLFGSSLVVSNALLSI